MKLSELMRLGPSNQLVASADPEVLGKALDEIVAQATPRYFTHEERIKDCEGSTILLLGKQSGQSRALDSAMTGHQVAEMLLRFTECGDARYRQSPGHNRVKGWIIRKVQFHGAPAAVAEAAWV